MARPKRFVIKYPDGRYLGWDFQPHHALGDRMGFIYGTRIAAFQAAATAAIHNPRCVRLVKQRSSRLESLEAQAAHLCDEITALKEEMS